MFFIKIENLHTHELITADLPKDRCPCLVTDISLEGQIIGVASSLMEAACYVYRTEKLKGSQLIEPCVDGWSLSHYELVLVTNLGEQS